MVEAELWADTPGSGQSPGWEGGGEGGLWRQEESGRLQGTGVNRLALSCASPFVFINMLCGVAEAL